MPILIAVISIILALGLNWVLRILDVEVPWWVDVPSLVGFYGLLYYVFDKCLWRVYFIRKSGLVRVPDLNGCWKGDISSSFDKHATRHDATVVVRQTWTRISITLTTENSQSHSLIGTILTEKSNGTILTYEYLNEPKPKAEETMHIHRGTARLVYSENSLEGDYYTGRDRQNFGSLTLHRER